jgi:hypothetical protein
MAIESDLSALSQLLYGRFMDLAMAPLRNQEMLWSAIPLAIATLFITLYFGRYRREELGWNTAFGNTMVFLFTAINLIKEMYLRGGGWESVMGNQFYLLLSAGLASSSVLLMLVTYFHLMPKRAAFFLFSAPPINVAVYVFMSVVYAAVPPDALTVLAGAMLVVVIVVLAKIIQLLVRLAGLAEAADKEDAAQVQRLAREVEDEIRRKGPGGPRSSHVQAPPPSRRTS